MPEDTKRPSRAAIEDEAHPSTPEERVAEASEESFPASDPPAWIAGSASPNGCEEEEEQDRSEES
jgi:hypothetical protein